MFDRNVYRARRERAAPATGPGMALFLGNDESPMNYADNTYRFRQDSSFLYYFGLDTAGLAAILDLDEGTEALYGPELTVEDFIWTGPLPSLKDRAALAGVTRVLAPARLEEDLKRFRQAGRAVHFLPPYRPENKLKLQAWLGSSRPRLGRGVGAVHPGRGRTEVRQVARGGRRDRKGRRHIRRYASHSPADGPARRDRGPDRRGRPPGGPGRRWRPVVPHHRDRPRRGPAPTRPDGDPRSGGMFLLDCGAETALHYAGDLSTTMPVDGSFSARQKDVYRIALAAHERAKSALKPGVPHLDVHLAACRTIAEGLKDLGLMKGDLDEAVRRGAHALFFPCGEGHMMGLDVHDMEDLGEVYVGVLRAGPRAPSSA